MSQQDGAWLRHQQQRWLRPDAHHWVRPDAARFLKPGSDVTDVYPALAACPGQRLRERRISEAIAQEQSVFAELGAELASLKTAIAQRKTIRTREEKYSQDQPRVSAGNGRESGRWGDAIGARPRVIIQTNNYEADPGGDGNGGGSGSGASTSAFDIGDVSSEAGSLGLFDITPRDNSIDGIQLAGDPPPGAGPGMPGDEPPKIPPQRPRTSSQRTAFFRAAANWLARHPGLAGEIYAGTMNNVEWLKDYHNLIHAARDEPKTLEELQANVGLKRPGYDDHHIVEKTWAEYFGFAKPQIDDPSNLASIPRLKHYQITGWYMTPNERYGGLSPREYLSDKDWDERANVGREALILFGVLKP